MLLRQRQVEAFEQGPRQSRQEFVDDGVVIDAVFDHVGVDEGEVGGGG